MKNLNFLRRLFLKISAASAALLALAGHIEPVSAAPKRLLGLFQGVRIDESIVVHRAVEDVFAFVTDFRNMATTSDNITDIEQTTDGPFGLGCQYERTLRIHGQGNRQVVTVDAYEVNALLATSTHIYDFVVTYTYRFTPLDQATTQIELTKEADVPGIWKVLRPLLHHLLTRPEHDGKHLLLIKAAVEA